ncbi:MAG: MFS transporter [Alphaproteobacteria bacterium]|nr:MFS transporter [Alphaproteobacteria bacterium]
MGRVRWGASKVVAAAPPASPRPSAPAGAQRDRRVSDSPESSRRARPAWLAALAVYREPRLIAVLLMGFSSGLPLALTGATLFFWLAELGVSLTTIGFFSLVGISYNVKFLWSPLIDRLPIPLLTSRLGRRRGWAVAIQLPLALAILALGLTDPRADPGLTALVAVIVAFLSASQDIVIDAYRIELLRPAEQGAGAAATQWGYRFGMLAAGAGALYAAMFGGWSFAYGLMATLMLVGIVTVLLTPEPGGAPAHEAPPGANIGERLRAWFERAVAAPFVDLHRRTGTRLLVAILLFIVLYKFGEALAGTMATPLYVSLGFAKFEVANVAKIYGLAATLAGLALGGVVVIRIGVFRALLACGVLQMLSNLMYAVQTWAGHDLLALSMTIGMENLTNGMGSAAFVAYLSGLCSAAFTATQYALLSSLAALGRTVLSAWGGSLAALLGWTPFFFLSTALCVPGLLLLLWVMRRPMTGLRAPP